MKKIKKGFTLIELLVVIAIIGILSTVVLVNLSGTRARARDARRRSDLANIRLAVEMYYDAQTTPAYPAAITDALLGSYMAGSKVPTDPKDPSKSYCYAVTNGMYGICTRPEALATVECTPAGTIPAACVDATYDYYGE